MYEACEQALLEEIEDLRGENATLVGTNRRLVSKTSGVTPAKLTVWVFLSIGALMAFSVVTTLLDQPPPTRTPFRTVPMALVDLEPGTIIRENDIGLGPYPVELIVGDILLNTEAVVGRLVTEPMKPADIFRASQLRRAPDAPPTAD